MEDKQANLLTRTVGGLRKAKWALQDYMAKPKALKPGIMDYTKAVTSPLPDPKAAMKNIGPGSVLSSVGPDDWVPAQEYARRMSAQRQIATAKPYVQKGLGYAAGGAVTAGGTATAFPWLKDWYNNYKNSVLNNGNNTLTTKRSADKEAAMNMFDQAPGQGMSFPAMGGFQWGGISPAAGTKMVQANPNPAANPAPAPVAKADVGGIQQALNKLGAFDSRARWRYTDSGVNPEKRSADTPKGACKGPQVQSEGVLRGYGDTLKTTEKFAGIHGNTQKGRDGSERAVPGTSIIATARGYMKSGSNSYSKTASAKTANLNVSAIGDSGLPVNYDKDNHSHGMDAWKSVSKYFKGGSQLSSEPDPTQGQHRGSEKSANMRFLQHFNNVPTKALSLLGGMKNYASGMSPGAAPASNARLFAMANQFRKGNAPKYVQQDMPHLADPVAGAQVLGNSDVGKYGTMSGEGVQTLLRFLKSGSEKSARLITREDLKQYKPKGSVQLHPATQRRLQAERSKRASFRVDNLDVPEQSRGQIMPLAHRQRTEEVPQDLTHDLMGKSANTQSGNPPINLLLAQMQQPSVGALAAGALASVPTGMGFYYGANAPQGYGVQEAAHGYGKGVGTLGGAALGGMAGMAAGQHFGGKPSTKAIAALLGGLGGAALGGYGGNRLANRLLPGAPDEEKQAYDLLNNSGEKIGEISSDRVHDGVSTARAIDGSLWCTSDLEKIAKFNYLQREEQRKRLEKTAADQGLNPYQAAFFTRCLLNGMNEEQIKQAVDQAHEKFGSDASAELYEVLEKQANMFKTMYQGAKTMGPGLMNKAKGLWSGGKGLMDDIGSRFASGAPNSVQSGMRSGVPRLPGPTTATGSPGTAMIPYRGMAAAGPRGMTAAPKPVNYGSARQQALRSIGGGMTGYNAAEVNSDSKMDNWMGAVGGALFGRHMPGMGRAAQAAGRRAFTGSMAGSVGDTAAGLMGVDTGGRLGQMGAIGGFASPAIKGLRPGAAGFREARQMSPALAKARHGVAQGVDDLVNKGWTQNPFRKGQSALQRTGSVLGPGAMAGGIAADAGNMYIDSKIQQGTDQLLSEMGTSREELAQTLQTAKGQQQMITQFGNAPDAILGPILGSMGMDVSQMDPITKWMILLGGGGMLGGLLGGGQGAAMGGIGAAALPFILSMMGGQGGPPQAASVPDYQNPGLPPARNELQAQQAQQPTNSAEQLAAG